MKDVEKQEKEEGESEVVKSEVTNIPHKSDRKDRLGGETIVKGRFNIEGRVTFNEDVEVELSGKDAAGSTTGACSCKIHVSTSLNQKLIG